MILYHDIENEVYGTFKIEILEVVFIIQTANETRSYFINRLKQCIVLKLDSRFQQVIPNFHYCTYKEYIRF